jgi:hypothetical protein
MRAISTRRLIVLPGTLGATSAGSMPALASDGVLEIDQTCAVQTGCFAGMRRVSRSRSRRPAAIH